MINLTETEKKVMNFSTQEIDPSVLLGNTIEDLIGFSIEVGTPVNAVAASASLTFSGNVADGEMVSIGSDIYEFCADEAQSLTYPDNIPVDIEIHSVKSTGTLTMAVKPTAGDTVTIGDKTYIFVPVGTDTADGEVSVGADLGEAQLNLVAAINGLDGLSTPNAYASAGAFAANASVITALVGGVAGDAIVTTENFASASNLFAAGVLSGGSDCLPADAVTALVLAVAASDTEGVGAVDGAGDMVVLTADFGGAAANDISVASTVANSSFANAATKLAGGADGTVSEGPKLYVDENYLYVCFLSNSLGGANWRRISLGNVY